MPDKYACGKKKYDSRKSAKTAMKSLNEKFGNSPEDALKDVYYCFICESWHTTSMPKEMCRNITRKIKKRL